MYLKSIGDQNLTADVAVVRDGMIHAIISERGGRKPDIIVISQMRAKLTAGNYTYRPSRTFAFRGMVVVPDSVNFSLLKRGPQPFFP